MIEEKNLSIFFRLYKQSDMRSIIWRMSRVSTTSVHLNWTQRKGDKQKQRNIDYMMRWQMDEVNIEQRNVCSATILVIRTIHDYHFDSLVAFGRFKSDK